MNNIEFDPSVDAAYIHIKETKVIESEEIAPSVILDYDQDNNIIGIEILNVSKQTESDIKKLPSKIQNLVRQGIKQIFQTSRA